MDGNIKVRFFNPHPGLAGAAITLPQAIKTAIDELAEKEMTLDEGLAKINASLIQDGHQIGELEVGSNHAMIFLWIPNKQFPPRVTTHTFRLLCFKQV